MDRRLRATLFLVVAVVAGATGFHMSRGSSSSPAAEGAAQKLAQATLSDISGEQQTVSQWRGKVLVVNFWATWCAPCREEIPALMKVNRKHGAKGVQLVGIAIDNVVNVRRYAAEMKIDYALLIGSMEIMGISKELGNQAGVLPFTVILDRVGKVAYAHAGALTEASLETVLTPLL